jgi:hypothetical protein
MSKKKELDQDRKFSVEDKNEILRLFRVAVATQEDMDSIYHLYKKYINDKAIMYQINCKCHTSIANYYQTILDYYGDNAEKFEN